MRTVPVSNGFSLSSHGIQKSQAFRQNKDKANKEMVWTWTLCPQAEFFLSDAYSDFDFPSGHQPWLRSDGEAGNGHKKCFHIFGSHTQHTRSIIKWNPLSFEPGVISKWSSAPSPRCRRRSPPACSQDGPDAAALSTCGKQRPRYISHSRNGRPHLGKESEIFKRLQTLGFRILKDILFSARAQTNFHTHGHNGSPAGVWVPYLKEFQD